MVQWALHSVGPFFFTETIDMRKKLSFKKHAKKHAQARRNTRAMNSPGYVLRGGRRL